MAESTNPLLDQILVEIARVLYPLEYVRSEATAITLIQELGWEVPSEAKDARKSLGNAFTAVSDTVSTIRSLINSLQNGDSLDISSLTNSIKDIFQDISKLKDGLDKNIEFFKTSGILDDAQLCKRLIDYLLVIYIQSYRPSLYAGLLLIGLIQHRENYWVIRWDFLPDLVSDPQNLLAKTWQWGDDTKGFDDAAFLSVVQICMHTFGIQGGLYPLSPAAQELLGDTTNKQEVRFPLYRTGQWGSSYIETGLSLFGLPSDQTPAKNGIAIVPYLFGSAQVGYSISGWDISLDAGDIATGNIVGLLLRPNEQPDLRENLPGKLDDLGNIIKDNNSVLIQAQIKITVARNPQVNKELYLLGKSGSSTYILLRNPALEFSADKLKDSSLSAQLSIDELALSIGAGSADSFLKRILPENGLQMSCGLIAGWSNKTGLTFSGGAGLERTIPINLSLAGIIEIDEIYLAIKATTEKLYASALVTMRAKIGPLRASVTRIGLGINLVRTLDNTGKLGALDLDIGFQPPTGVGLAIEAGPVVGGGFLFIDREKGQYAGILQLEFKAIALKAIGLLNTRMPDGSPILMPDGSEGFSLLIIISAEFNPIQLAYGFTLNGVGGLLGINRNVAVDVLRAGIRDRTLDAIMFPPDPIANAPQIISKLSNVFPVAPARYVFGPMARIAWGRSILTFDIGLVLQLPSPIRLIILGRLRVVLPTDQAAVVSIRMDVIGIIDFDRCEVSIDATLYDSFLAKFALTGDMALRASWGRSPTFALSAGGFNPRFQPPLGFPSLQRLAISLATGENPRLRLESYFALTSNTVQFGARLDLYATAAGFSIEGMLAFDALLQLSPFEFIVDIAGAISVKRGSRVLMGATVQMTLSGPTPWHAVGWATFEFWGLKKKVSFDAQSGDPTPPELPPPVNVGVLLNQELADPRNWTAQLPPTGESLVTLRRIEIAEKKVLLAHPLGSIGFDQRVVPLGVNLTRYGAARIEGDTKFEFTSVSLICGDHRSTLTTSQVVREYFARAQFCDMTDDEKLSSPSFEPIEAGRRFDPISLEDYDFDAFAPPAIPIEYKVIIIDDPDEPARVQAPERLIDSSLKRLAQVSAAGYASIRAIEQIRCIADARALQVHDTTYEVIGLEQELIEAAERRFSPISPKRGTTYTSALEELRHRAKQELANTRLLRVVAAGGLR